MHADGVVISNIGLDVFERECSVRRIGRDHIVEASILGTAIAQFDRSPRPGRALQVMPLT